MRVEACHEKTPDIKKISILSQTLEMRAFLLVYSVHKSQLLWGGADSSYLRIPYSVVNHLDFRTMTQ